MASSVSDDSKWQISRRTLLERNRFMFNNSLMSDVKFVVPKKYSSNVVDETKVIIPAHRYILAISSPVFFAMFNGHLAETQREIQLPDCDSECLQEFLRFLYYDDIRLSGNCVMGVLYLATKYMVPSLTERCSEYLKENLSEENVFSVLPHAQKYEDETLLSQCWDIVESKTENAIKSEPFLDIERSLLKSVLKRDLLMVQEVDLFKAVDRWAEKQCVRQGFQTKGEEKRNVLGEDVVTLIRFPVMSLKSFSLDVVGKNILFLDEVSSILQQLHGAEVPNMKFSVVPRIPCYQICERFLPTPVNKKSWCYNGGTDRIQLSVTQNILILGVQLFGSEGGEYTAEVQLSFANTMLAQKTQFSESVEGREGCYCFDVYFDHPVEIQANKVCLLEAKITGPMSFLGTNGIKTVETGGVRFQFSTFKQSTSNGTTVDRGQFPKLYFAVIPSSTKNIH